MEPQGRFGSPEVIDNVPATEVTDRTQRRRKPITLHLLTSHFLTSHSLADVYYPR